MPVGGCRVSGRKAPSQWPGLFALRASSSERDRAEDIGASAPFVSREQGPERTVRRAAWAPAGRRRAPASALWEQPPQSTRQQRAAAAAARGDGPVPLAPTGAAQQAPNGPTSAHSGAPRGGLPHPQHPHESPQLAWRPRRGKCAGHFFPVLSPAASTTRTAAPSPPWRVVGWALSATLAKRRTRTVASGSTCDWCARLSTHELGLSIAISLSEISSSTGLTACMSDSLILRKLAADARIA